MMITISYMCDMSWRKFVFVTAIMLFCFRMLVLKNVFLVILKNLDGCCAKNLKFQCFHLSNEQRSSFY